MASITTHQNDTICAIATGSGTSAISMIRVTGSQAIPIVNTLFQGRNLEESASHKAHFGRILKDNKLIDEVVVTVFKSPRTYTGEDLVEISCHGSHFIRENILRLLIAGGARLANPGEFTMLAFLNGKLDLSQAEAVADLIEAETESAHEIALQQMRGGFALKLKALRQQLLDFASLVELELDFGEEDVDFADRGQLEELVHAVLRVLGQLMESFKTGNAIKSGIPVVIAGKPNAGKSTLLNTLLQEERAIVSDIAGTTRDVIEDELVIDGMAYRFIDTAGIRDTADEIEAIGVAKTLEKLKSAAIVLYLFDVNEPAQDITQAVEQLRTVTQGTKANLVLVANKVDVIGVERTQQKFAELAQNELHYLSAKSESALQTVTALLKVYTESNLTQSDVVVSNSRHFEALGQAHAALTRVAEGLNHEVTGDFLAMDIRQALHFLGSITGEVSNDELLGNIFANFCIGK